MSNLGNQLGDIKDLFPELEGIKLTGNRVFLQFFYMKSTKKIATNLQEADQLGKGGSAYYLAPWGRILMLGSEVSDGVKEAYKVGDIVLLEQHIVRAVAQLQGGHEWSYKDSKEYTKLASSFQEKTAFAYGSDLISTYKIPESMLVKAKGILSAIRGKA